MNYPAFSAADSKTAQLPHQLFMFNMVGNHVLMMVITVSQLYYGYLIGAIVPAISLLIIAYTLLAARKHLNSPSILVRSHWQVAIKRTKLLLTIYAIAAVGGLFDWYLYAGLHMMKELVIAAFVGLAFLPVMLTVLYLAVMESQLLNQAKHGIPAGGEQDVHVATSA